MRQKLEMIMAGLFLSSCNAPPQPIEPALSYICSFPSNVELALVKQVQDNSAQAAEEWEAKIDTELFHKTTRSELRGGKGGSFALNWTQPDGAKIAYVTLGGIIGQNEIRPMSVEMLQDDGTKLKATNCSAFAVN